jgi:hypothetical protein
LLPTPFDCLFYSTTLLLLLPFPLLLTHLLPMLLPALLLLLPWCLSPLQRHDDRRKEIEGMMAIVAKADATDRAAVDKVFAGERHLCLLQLQLGSHCVVLGSRGLRLALVLKQQGGCG